MSVSSKLYKITFEIYFFSRSGQEGIYPDLIKFCENRLREFAPQSRLLQVATKMKRYCDLSENERRDIEKELEVI